MYNMEISIRIELIIFIAVIFIIIITHTLCGCSKVGLLEGYEALTDVITDEIEIKSNPSSQTKPNSKPKDSVPTSAMSTGKKEGFVGGSNINEPSQYKVGDYSQVDTSNWAQPNLIVTPGQPYGQGVKQFMSRQEQPIPLPEGELLMFANTPFKPECCPSTYSNSAGCACITGKQYNYLIERGSNNVPYSEF